MRDVHRFHEEDVNCKFQIPNSGCKINDPLARYLISHLVPVALLCTSNNWFSDRYDPGTYGQEPVIVIEPKVRMIWPILVSNYLRNRGSLWQLKRAIMVF